MTFRWRCERLKTDSVRNPCADAKKRELANCVGCKGAKKIEKKVEPVKKPDNRTCIYTDCDKWRVIGEYCTHHAREAEEASKIYVIPPAPEPVEVATQRVFETGATRSPLGEKLQYEGYLSPLALKRFAEYMRKHQTQSDGTMRDSDNWQKGIPKGSLMDSAMRHFMDWWMHHRQYQTHAAEPLEEALCGLLFNCMAYLKAVLEEASHVDCRH